MNKPKFGPRDNTPMPPLPPVLSQIFPKTSATMRKLTPAQAIGFIELLVKQLNRDQRLPVHCTITKRTPFELSIDVKVTTPAIDAPPDK